MNTTCWIALLGIGLSFALTAAAFGQDTAAEQPVRILFLSKSQAFEHSPVAEKGGKPSIAAMALAQLAEENGAQFEATKNASVLNAENLKNYDLVILYTQGDLTKDSKDGGDNASPQGQEDLVNWVREGGRLMGFHSASDTYHTPENGEVTPYLKTTGAEFAGHGGQFKGTVKVVDAAHPAMAHVPRDWSFQEEWYTFKNWNADAIRVLALLDPGAERAKQKMYDVAGYPVIWVNACGKGKVYFNAIGHRDELWNDPVFQQTIVDAAEWLMTPGLDGTEPNYAAVVPKE